MKNGKQRSGKLRLLAMLSIGLTVLASLTSIRPAAAGTAEDTKFIRKVYLDYVQREPNADEITWWLAYLSGGSRTTMVKSVLEGDEFETMWAVGAFDFYLPDDDYDLDVIESLRSSLDTSGNYLATEATLLASNAYWARAGSTNSGFVTLVFQDVLHRAPDAPGLAYWVNKLATGTTRANMVSSILRSSESATRRVSGVAGATSCYTTIFDDASSIAAGSYCLVLDRMSDAPGASYWTGVLSGSGQLPTLWASLSASNEYYTHAQAL